MGSSTHQTFICKDDSGNVLISIENIDEMLLSQNSLLTHCLAVVKIENDYLLGWNKWRGRYEIFGGCIEKGETARDCITRNYPKSWALKAPPQSIWAQ